MMCDNDVASLLMEEVAEIDCSTFLMEEIEIEMQQEQFSKFNIDSSATICIPTSVHSPLKSNYNQLVLTGSTCITAGETESSVPASTITATNLLNHSISNHIDREGEGTLLTTASQNSPSQVSLNSLQVFTTFLEDVEEVVECSSSGEPIDCQDNKSESTSVNKSCSKTKRKHNQSPAKQQAEQQNIEKQLLAPPPPSTSSSLVCKWTDCDWPGSYEDLVDHIRELHVELQPFESTQLQLFLTSHKNTTNGSRSNNNNKYNNNNNNQAAMGSSSSRMASSSSSTSSSPNASTASSPLHRASENDASLQPSQVNTTAATNCSSSSSNTPSSSTTNTNTNTNTTSNTSSRCRSSRSSISSDFSSRAIHDEPEKSYVCLWEGCKVYGVRSQKRSWLDRHVLQHSGDKPFKCIVENCGERFKSQSALEKHVNQHFKSSNSNSNGHLVKDSISNCSISNSDGSSEHGSDDSTRRTTMMRAKSAKSMCSKETQSKQPNATNGSCNSVSGTPCKLNTASKKRKVPRLRRVLVRGCSEDFFDSFVMDIIQFRLFKLNHLTGCDSIDRIALHSKVPLFLLVFDSPPLPLPPVPLFITFFNFFFFFQVIAKRVDDLGQTHLLLRWFPENVVPDEWIQQSELDTYRFKSAPLSLLPPSLEFISSNGSTDCRSSDTVTAASPSKRKRK